MIGWLTKCFGVCIETEGCHSDISQQAVCAATSSFKKNTQQIKELVMPTL